MSTSSTSTSSSSFKPETPEEVSMDGALKRLALTAKSREQQLRFEAESRGFLGLFRRFLRLRSSGSGEHIDWDSVRPPPPGMVADHAQLPPAGDARALLGKLCVVKLNGGLGTTMGCTGPKSLIRAQGAQTFLDLIVAQLQRLNRATGADVPLLLMDSFNTHAETLRALPQYERSGVRVLTFVQSRHPRFDRDTLAPLPKTLDAPDAEWYPPGHADFYAAFAASGLLEAMAREGREYAFVSNVDNLGATVDLAILQHLAAHGVDFAMEVTPKTRADVKGGTLIATAREPDRPRLLELAQVPPDHVRDFESIGTFTIFNTNNIWVRLGAIEPLLASGRLHEDIDLIVNRKQLSPQQTVVQLETAIGAAIRFFDHAIGIRVPRSRFLPVKATSDLLLLQSNLHTLDCGTLSPNPARAKKMGESAPAPTVRLGPEFRKVSDFLRRFQGPPDMLELESLTVSGDVCFGCGVVLRGNVVIVAAPGAHIDIPSGAILDNKLVQGGLFVTDLQVSRATTA